MSQSQEKNWYSSYEAGVPHEIGALKFSNLGEFSEYYLGQYHDKIAFTCMGKSITFQEALEWSDRLGSFLEKEWDLGQGSKVALMMPNILQYPIALIACLRLGITVVNVNPLYTPRELSHIIQDSGAEAIIILENFAHVLEKAKKNVSIDHVLITSFGDLFDFPKKQLVNFAVKYVKKMVPPYEIAGSQKFATIMADYKGQKIAHKSKHGLDDIALIQYTGGTTGVSKGALLSHGNLLSNLEQAHLWAIPCLEEGKELIVTALPLYHIFSFMANLLLFIRLGGHNLLIPNPRDLDGFIKELQKYPFTAFFGINTLFNALINHKDIRTVDFSHLHYTLGGGMAVQKSVAEKWKQITGSTLLQAYGLTETSPAACINPGNSSEFNGSVGLPISSTEVTIRDDEGHELKQGEVGEVVIKGPQVTKGYLNRPEENKLAFTEDGAFKTGDMGYIDEKGYVFLVDRKKDMILVSGFNVYPNEIEEVCVAHDKVLEAAAVGKKDERSGEVVKVFIVKKDESLTEEELLAYCKEQLTPYKVPKEIVFKDSLPKSNVGKILRKDLKDE